jgi:hypothetical protein
VIKFVSDLRQVGGFFSGTSVSSTNKTDRHHIAEILLKVVLNTITLTSLKEKGGGGLLDYSFVLYSCDNRDDKFTVIFYFFNPLHDEMESVLFLQYRHYMY